MNNYINKNLLGLAFSVILFGAQANAAIEIKPLVGFSHRDSSIEWSNPGQYGGEISYHLSDMPLSLGIGGYFNPTGSSAYTRLDSMTGNDADADEAFELQEHNLFVKADYQLLNYFSAGLQAGTILYRETIGANKFSNYEKSFVMGGRAAFSIPLDSVFAIGSQTVVSWYFGNRPAIGFMHFGFLSATF